MPGFSADMEEETNDRPSRLNAKQWTQPFRIENVWRSFHFVVSHK
jgi:hypothetical protein